MTCTRDPPKCAEHAKIARRPNRAFEGTLHSATRSNMTDARARALFYAASRRARSRYLKMMTDYHRGSLISASRRSLGTSNRYLWCAPESTVLRDERNAKSTERSQSTTPNGRVAHTAARCALVAAHARPDPRDHFIKYKNIRILPRISLSSIPGFPHNDTVFYSAPAILKFVIFAYRPLSEVCNVTTSNEHDTARNEYGDRASA